MQSNKALNRTAPLPVSSSVRLMDNMYKIIIIFFMIIYLLSGLCFIKHPVIYASKSKQLECSKNQFISKKLGKNVKDNNIIIQMQITTTHNFIGGLITKTPKILITKEGTWSSIEDDIPLEKNITKDGGLTITELKKVRRVAQKKLSKNQMEQLHTLIHKINNFEALKLLSFFDDMEDDTSYTSLSINYNDDRPVVTIDVGNYNFYIHIDSEEYYHKMKSYKAGELIKYEVAMSNWNAYFELVKFIDSLGVVN